VRFNGSHKAEEALEEVIKTKCDRNPWLYDVGAVARPRIGRVRSPGRRPGPGAARKCH
jgi:hypothetical protein